MKVSYSRPKHYIRWGIISGLIGSLILTLVVTVVDKAQGVCNASPPDYPGCTIAQVDSIAKNNVNDWLDKKRFGTTNDILAAAGLTSAQRDKVIAATRTEVKQTLIAMRQRAQSMTAFDASTSENGEFFDAAGVWHTTWRGTAYTVDSFPIIKYVAQLYNNPDDPNCYAQRYKITYAYGWCGAPHVPDGWDNYWGALAAGLEASGGMIKIHCGWEVVLGLGVGAFASAWTGPGVLAGALVGGGSQLLYCAGKQLGDARGW